MFRLTCVLGICLSAATLVDAQSDKIQKTLPKALQERFTDENLAKLLADALKNNPDIRVADAKMREAEAELVRTRLKVVADITQLHAEIQSAQVAVEGARKKVERLKELLNNKAIEERIVDEAMANLERAKAELAAKQAKLPYLLGKQTTALDVDDMLRKKWLDKDAPLLSDDEFLRRATLDVLGRMPLPAERDKFMSLDPKNRRKLWIDHLLQAQPLAAPNAQDAADTIVKIWNIYLKTDSPMIDRLRKALDTPVVFKDEARTEDLMDFVRTKLAGVNLQDRFKSPKSLRVNLDAPVPLGAFLQFLEDELRCVFVLRDYGIVVVAADEKLPPGAISVVDFWKRSKSSDVPAEKKMLEPLPNGTRGTIENIDPKDATIVMLSIGADAGLKAGQMIDVFRAGPQPKYLGSIRIANTTPQKSVGRLASYPGGGAMPVLQVGDEVGAVMPK